MTSCDVTKSTSYIASSLAPIIVLPRNAFEYALAVFNFCDGDIRRCVEFYDIGISAHSGYGLQLEEIFTGEKITAKENVFVNLKPHTCAVYKAKVVEL